MTAQMPFTRCQAPGCCNLLAPPGPHPPRKWCSGRCRKTQYAAPCVDCGGPTSGSEGRRDAARCHLCAARRVADERTIWTRAAVILAIQEWAAEYGEPPAVADWNPYTARHELGDDARARRFEDAAGSWPRHVTVYAVCGSWNAAIEAAGFEPRARGGGGGNEQRRRQQTKAAA